MFILRWKCAQIIKTSLPPESPWENCNLARLHSALWENERRKWKRTEEVSELSANSQLTSSTWWLHNRTNADAMAERETKTNCLRRLLCFMGSFRAFHPDIASQNRQLGSWSFISLERLSAPDLPSHLCRDLWRLNCRQSVGSRWPRRRHHAAKRMLSARGGGLPAESTV